MNENYYLQSDIKEIFNNLKHLKKNLSGKKFLISGANGFLGKYFIRSLIEIRSSRRTVIGTLGQKDVLVRP